MNPTSSATRQVKNKALISIIISAIIIRILLLKEAIYDDEAIWASLTTLPNPLWLNNVSNYHPPLSLWFYNFGVFLFGQHTMILRLVTVCIAIATIILTYVLAKKLYNTKVATISVLIMSFSIYHIIASLRITIGLFLVLFYLLTFYSFLSYEESKKNKWLLLTGFFFGCSIMTKYSAIYMLPVFGLYWLYKSNDLKQSFIETTKIVFIGALTFLIYPFLVFLRGDFDIIINTLTHAAHYQIFGFHWVAPVMLMLWATPLLICIPLLSVVKKNKKDMFLIIWVACIFAINFVLIGRGDVGNFFFLIGRGDYVRYFMNLIPPLSILSAAVISRLNIQYKHLPKIITVSAIFTVILFFINSISVKYIPQVFSLYISEILKGNLNFFFSYTTSSGALFGTSALGIILTWGVCLILTVAIIIKLRQKQKATFLLILLIGIAFAFNLFLAQEYVFHTQHVDPSEATYFAVDYFRDNNLQYPLYTNSEGIYYYLIPDYIFSDREHVIEAIPHGIGKYLEADNWYDKITSTGGTVIILNHPTVNKDRIAKLDNCDLLNTYESNDIDLLFIYSCDKDLV
jgi:4-amino-4-deoxy-L-arabinose transferase-like glycosyltransferase